MIFGPTKGSNSCKLIVHNIILANQKIEWSVNLWLYSHAMFKVARARTRRKNTFPIHTFKTLIYRSN